MVNIDELRFDEKGLIPAVVVDTYSKKVLTVAYMNKESLAISMKEGRKKEKPEGSYTTYLFEKGLDKILKKVGEECTEVIIAAKAEDRAETIYEIADLTYHVMVLMTEQGISLADIRKELAKRHIIDHKVKQEKMTK